MEDIIINGVNLAELKVKYDALAAEQAAMRKSIQSGASKFIAENIEQAKTYIQAVLDAETAEEVDKNSKLAFDTLKTVKFVSDVSGVSYTLPYYDRQSEYCPDGKCFSSQIDESENELLDFARGTLSALYGLLETMESEVSEWNTSYC